MRMSFQRIAYERLDVCNGVEMSAIESLIERAGPAADAIAVDVGAGNGSVAIRLAQRFALTVAAIEHDPGMADLARARVAAANLTGKVTIVVAPAGDALRSMPVADLIVALGTTDVSGDKRPTPAAALAFLRSRLKPGGWLLWGDLVWLTEPPTPLRQLVEATNLYADDVGWRAAALAAGFEIVQTRLSPQTVFDAYARDSVGAVRDWLASNPDAPEAPQVAFNADRVQAFFDFGRGVMGFGLYLLRNPA